MKLLNGRPRGLVAECEGVQWYKNSKVHCIVYGLQSTFYDDDLAACHGFGECVRHSLECEGKLD